MCVGQLLATEHLLVVVMPGNDANSAIKTQLRALTHNTDLTSPHPASVKRAQNENMGDD